MGAFRAFYLGLLRFWENMGAFGSILEHVGSILELLGALQSRLGAYRISPFGAYRISHIASRVRLGLGDLSTFNIDLQYKLPNIDGDIYRGYIFDLEHP